MSLATTLNTDDRSASPNPRPGRGRLLAEFAVVTALSLLVLLPHFHVPIVDTDEGIIAVGAERILSGQVPYRDFFSELGPASFYLHAAIFKLGATNLAAMRLTAWLLGGLISALIYLLARKILAARWAVAAASIFPLVCYPLGYRVSHHWWANLLLLLTVLALAEAEIPARQTGGRRRVVLLGLAGCLAGLTLLTMQSKGFWAILMGVVFLLMEPWLAPREERPACRDKAIWSTVLFVAGATAITGFVVAYFASQAALGAWIDANVVFLFTNYRAYLDVPQSSAFLTLIHIGRLALDQPTVHMYLYFLGYLFFFFLAPLVAYAGAGALLVRKRLDPSPESRTVLILLLQSVGAFLSEYHSPDAVHMMWAAPLMLILLVYVWVQVGAGVRRLRRPMQVAAALAAALMLFTAGRKAINTLRIDGRVETRRGTLYVNRAMVPKVQARINAVEERVPRGEKTFFYPYMAELYFLTATRNPTRYDVLLPDFHRPTQIDEAIAAIRHDRPSYVFGFDRIQLLTIRPHFPDDPPDMIRPHPVGKALAAPGSGYELETIVEDMEVWVAKP